MPSMRVMAKAEPQIGSGRKEKFITNDKELQRYEKG
jgi:hypothetical protein